MYVQTNTEAVQQTSKCMFTMHYEVKMRTKGISIFEREGRMLCARQGEWGKPQKWRVLDLRKWYNVNCEVGQSSVQVK